MKNKYFVAVNPNSGAGKAGKDWKKIEQKLITAGFDFEVAVSSAHRETITQVSNAIKNGFSKIITVGGDGTLHHVVNGIFNQTEVPSTEIEVGMISVGTGNDWVRHFGIPTKYDKAIEVIKRGKLGLQDIGKLVYNNASATEYFMNFVGIGYDAYVVENTAHLKKFGQSAYLYGLVQCLFKFDAKKLKISADGKELMNEDVFMLIAGLGKYGGGGMMLSPDADINDGLFDVTIGKDLSKSEIIMMVHKLFNGTYVDHEKVETVKCKTLRIEANTDEVKTEADGELVGTGPFDISLLPSALKFYI